MKAKVFSRGNSQVVRIPKECRIRSSEVEISRRGDEIVLRELPESLARAFRLLSSVSSDFMKGGRRQPKTQEREPL